MIEFDPKRKFFLINAGVPDIETSTVVKAILEAEAIYGRSLKLANFDFDQR